MRTKGFLYNSYENFGIFILRATVGSLMLLGHGMPNLMNFYQSYDTFPDPLGIGNEISFFITIFTEVICSMALILGLFTRLAVIPIIITMLITMLVINIDDPWPKKELAIVYLLPYITLYFTGSGEYSMDKGVLDR
ncbi:DoxX family protein [Fulvivirgaceae bacterium BMA12]|uniref:DoxX family protein n=1 Tax=Agaribacillus aureus TaxID=3051825 RepID=A0ABT8L011_9BACT|nr:DoxX family protein [Fulvivirgaceae bacterium BMA12]